MREGAGGSFSFGKVRIFFLKYAIPFSFSAGVAYLSTLWIQEGGLNKALSVFLKWLSENGSFYASLWLCGKFLPKEEKVFSEGSESFVQLLAVEGLDTLLRALLFWFSSYFPKYEAAITAAGSFALDLAFLGLVSRSHRLVEIIRTLLEGRVKGRFLPNFGNKLVFLDLH